MVYLKINNQIKPNLMIIKYLFLLMIIMSFNNKQPYKEKSYSENINDVQINKPEIQQIIIKHYGGRSLNDSIVYVINNKSFEFHVYSKKQRKII